ncbi:putative cytochrome P450 [Lineolata rhizophorae]|uniref:Putative cytochrome P450 n=1 Tax=Lineolata rhizophorae TaxID=578093 RepID=A0A6A6P3F7_9PEZI|nr:putative cytochrome P450 [Lineolata rhizophorae]
MMIDFWVLGAGLLGLWLVARSFYRLYLHPLAKFPGYKFTALTHWYEGYYDVVKKGRYVWEFERMHRKYGPIVRIGPNELHILDPGYYNTLYSMTNRIDKYDWFYSMMGNPEAMFATIRAETHKARRGAVAPFFSMRAVTAFYPHVQGGVTRLVNRMEECAKRGEPIPLFYAYRCLTVDIISEYVFGGQFGLLNRPDWGRDFYSAWRSMWELSPVIRQIPILMDIMMAMPRWVTAMINPKGLEVVDLFAAVDKQTKTLLEETSESKIRAKPYPTVIWEVSRSDVLPPEEKTLRRLSIEANSLLAAGFETTAAVLSLLTFQVVSHPEVYKKLVDSLEKEIPDPNNMPDWQKLEKIPYLFGVVKESLRMDIGPTGRLARVNRNQPMKYKDWVIPAGTAVGMSALYIEMNPDVFHDPGSFLPERWLEPGARERLEPYLATFGKGSRSCVGINLAYAELYSVAATIFRRFSNLEVYETTERDMEAYHDYFGGMTRHERDGLKVRVKK